MLAEPGKINAWADATHNRYRALLSGIFRRAVKNGKASENPVRETAHRKENNQRVRYLANEEEQIIVKVVRKKKWSERKSRFSSPCIRGCAPANSTARPKSPIGGL